MKKTYAAKVIWMNQEEKQIETTIYSSYESVVDAMEGVKRFLTVSHNPNLLNPFLEGIFKVVKVWVE